MKNASQSELGKQSIYDAQYNPDKLFPIARTEKRNEINVPYPLPFFGFDLWNHYEVSWLNAKGKPIVAVAEICYGCETPYIIESKSLKLYFNSFNQTRFNDIKMVEDLIKKDIAKHIEGEVFVKLILLNELPNPSITTFKGICLDELDITCDTYLVDPTFLTVETGEAQESLFSHLLKSNCLVTNQPDWGSVQITYQGPTINREGLLRYLVSFRNHNEFHEQCIERIFMDILRYCKPTVLTVYGRYTRRGGLDINPYRSTQPIVMPISNPRLHRQ